MRTLLQWVTCSLSVLSIAVATPTSVTSAERDVGLTLIRYNNTAFAGRGVSQQVVTSLEGINDCVPENNERLGAPSAATCGAPSSFLLVGRISPPNVGKYGFNVTFDPPLPFPSPNAYARLWVNDHLLYVGKKIPFRPKHSVEDSVRLLSRTLWEWRLIAAIVAAASGCVLFSCALSFCGCCHLRLLHACLFPPPTQY